ncbi:peptide deformylase [Carnobacteriaceae bacterium zg-ZUI252]|nr:peptide deformylase [Carnobacteriaceae bacterium zg-ZUI252]
MLLMKDIIREGHPTLRLKAEELTFPLDAETKKIAENMLQFLHNSQNEEIAEKYELRAGVGIAAPQINLSKRLIALLLPGEYEDDPYILNMVMVNPKIVKHSVQQTCLKDGEGCLSVDRAVHGYVPRHQKITVDYYTLDGEQKTITLRGLAAIVVQHEIDHLDGVMFYDRIDQDNPLALPDGIKVLSF